jgi:hypothetical protein
MSLRRTRIASQQQEESKAVPTGVKGLALLIAVAI